MALPLFLLLSIRNRQHLIRYYPYSLVLSLSSRWVTVPRLRNRLSLADISERWPFYLGQFFLCHKVVSLKN